MSKDTVASLNREAIRKLQLGLQRLEKAGDDIIVLGSALTSLHGALEDCVRSKLATNSAIPSGQRAAALDRQKTSWLQLLDLLEQYDDLDRNDRQVILHANNLRQDVAHGNDYDGTREELEEYAEFVQAFIGGGQVLKSSFTDLASAPSASMRIHCPCGSKCRGRDRSGQGPECYLSYSGRTIPYEFKRGEGFWAQVLGGIASELVGANYEAYQCPVCGCQVLFGSYQLSTGFRKKRVADTCSC